MMQRRHPMHAALPLIFLCFACSNEETRHCHALMTTAQELVKKVDGADLSSVRASIDSVESARAACEKAGRRTEQEELVAAKNQLQAHADYLERKAKEPAKKKQTPEELAALVQHGDPGCPKGQAYRPAPAQEVRCTGPQLVDMSWKSVEGYFNARGYKITTTDTPPVLKAEYGAELLAYTFAKPKDDQPARCLAYYPPPGLPWQEATARVTGAPLRKLENAHTVRTAQGERTLRVDESEKKLIIYVGECL
jgi:hypothetical protein